MNLHATIYRNGAIVHWPVVGQKVRQAELPIRGKIHDLTKRSRIRCAWALSNAPRDWGAMAVLTFRTQPQEPKRALKRFVRSFRRWFGPDVQWAWVMEWQLRGVVHFHLFFERDLIESLGCTVEQRVRRGVNVAIVRGFFDDWIVKTWLEAVGDKHEDFEAFQKGGIVELLRSPDAAARYVAKEAGKRAQKQLPDGVNACGRWWWISSAGKPQPIRRMTLSRYPLDQPYRLIFDSRDLFRRIPREEKRVSTHRPTERSTEPPTDLQSCRPVERTTKL